MTHLSPPSLGYYGRLPPEIRNEIFGQFFEDCLEELQNRKLPPFETDAPRLRPTSILFTNSYVYKELQPMVRSIFCRTLQLQLAPCENYPICASRPEPKRHRHIGVKGWGTMKALLLTMFDEKLVLGASGSHLLKHTRQLFLYFHCCKFDAYGGGLQVLNTRRYVGIGQSNALNRSHRRIDSSCAAVAPDEEQEVRRAFEAFTCLEDMVLCFPNTDFMSITYEAESRLLRRVLEHFTSLPTLKHLYLEEEVIDGAEWELGWDRITTAFAVSGKKLQDRRPTDLDEDIMIESLLHSDVIEERSDYRELDDYDVLHGPWIALDVCTVMRPVDANED